MKGRSQMTSTVFGYDHIMMRAEYRTPDPHSHLAVHFIAGLDGPVHCVVSGDSFDADAVFIASDVVHTAYAETGDMLVFLFDTAGSIAEEAQKQYLCGRPYFCGDKETVEKLREIWKNNPPAQADSLITQLLGLDTVGNTLRDERISQVLEYLAGRSARGYNSPALRKGLPFSQQTVTSFQRKCGHIPTSLSCHG